MAPTDAPAALSHQLLLVCRYWRYNEETRSADRDFPKPISRWGKIPASPRGAFLSDDGGTASCL